MENTCDGCNKDMFQSFCISCNKMLCNTCRTRHKNKHSPKKTSCDCSSDIKLCSECKRYGYMRVSDKICSGCVRNLCNECSGLHKCKNDNGRKGFTFDTPVCQPCEKMAIITTATSICVDCDEFLCERCCDMHLASKAFENHKLRPIQVPGNIIKNTLLCESCKSSNIEEPATFTCCDCDNELFCKNCATQHTTFKTAKHHKMLSTVLPSAKFTDNKGEQTESIGKEDKGTETFPNKDSLNNSKYTPGRPEASYIGIDSVTLTWKEAECNDYNGYYQVSYIENDDHGKWVYINDQTPTVSNITIRQLKTNTAYRIRVRIVNEIAEGPYSPLSDKIITRYSSAGMLMSFSKKIQNGQPSPDIYALPISENLEKRNEKAKTKRFEIGEIGTSTMGSISTEKTIMIVGTSGSGKCSFVDSMINYILGVQWTDTFRFRTRGKQIKEDNKSAWINMYSICPEQGSRLQYRLNIIDVPCFDASKPLTENLGTIEQVRVLLSESSPLGLDYLHAVCFVVKSTDSEMSKFQDRMFQYILSSFGKDIKENIFIMLTFSDCQHPPILNSLSETDLPFRKTFKFNCSAFFHTNVELNVKTTLPLFWDAANESFDSFFKELDKTKVQGMQQTTAVIEQQIRMEQNFEAVQKQVKYVLQKINELNNEQNKIDYEENLIKANESFKMVVDNTVHDKSETIGSFAVNCKDCKVTCCKNVACQTDEIEKCDVFDSSGRCKSCKNNCLPQSHEIESNIYEIRKEPVTKIDQTKKDAFDRAKVELQKLEIRVSVMSRQMNEECDKLQESEKMKSCRQQIKENSLWPYVKDIEKKIELSIEKEMEEREEGFIDRIRKMKESRKYLEITNDIDRFAQDARSVLCVVGRNRPENADALSNLTRFVKLFNHLHSE